MKYNRAHRLITDLCQLLMVDPDELFDAVVDLKADSAQHSHCVSLMEHLSKDRERLYDICFELWRSHLQCRKLE